MPAHITVSSLCYATPDGRSLLSDLDIAFPPIRTGLVGRNGVGKSSLIQLITGTLAPRSGTITRDGTISVLRQSLQPEPGETIADLFGVTDALAHLARAEAGIADAEDLARTDWTLESRMAESLARFGLTTGPTAPLTSLSGGQRTRAMLAALVYAAPDFIILDEPTNNLDRDGRAAVGHLLAQWRGGAIVVSHDRDLLEAMDQIVELTGLGATTYGGGYSAYRERRAVEMAAAEQDLVHAEQRMAEVEKKARQRQERQQKRNAAGKRKRIKGDAPKILLDAKKDNAEKSGGANARLADRTRSRAATDAWAARERIEVLEAVTVEVPPTHLPPSRKVLTLESVAAGYQEGASVIEDFSLTLIGPERVAVTGPNGSGKSTLLRVITGALGPRQGTVDIHVPCAFLDQQVSLLDRSTTIRENYLRLHPSADETVCRSALARFKFRADAALQQVGALSGGETLRAGLACVLGTDTPPHLLILDEPTNHLDLEAIEAVEAGLRGYDGALLVVSHDRAFLERIEITRTITLPP